MDLEFAFLSDFAEESGGKLHALGIGVDTIHAAEVPARHPQLTMVAQIRYSVAEAGTHRLEVSGYDADGKEIIDRIEGDMPLPPVTGGTSGDGARAGEPRRRELPRLRRSLVPPRAQRHRGHPRIGSRRAAAWRGGGGFLTRSGRVPDGACGGILERFSQRGAGDPG